MANNYNALVKNKQRALRLNKYCQNFKFYHTVSANDSYKFFYIHLNTLNDVRTHK